MLGQVRSAARLVRRSFRRLGFDIIRAPVYATGADTVLRPEFSEIAFAAVALQTLLDHYEFSTVLDVGCGSGSHTSAFLRHGKQVTAVDYGRSVYFERRPTDLTVLLGDFNEMSFDTQFDCVWASHVLEHQPNAHSFLCKVIDLTRQDGTVAITVPPLKSQIVGGHLSLWNAGLLLYNLVVAGLDCRQAAVLQYGYNISVLVKKRTFTVPTLSWDKGDVDRLSEWFPAGLAEGFDGDIGQLNWPATAR